MLIVEISSGEGGEDSKLFVNDLCDIYRRYSSISNLKFEIVSEKHGQILVKISGNKAWSYFQNESGKHVIQRIPPTEKNGRRQTSVVSVSVMPLPPENIEETLNEKDLEIKFQCSSGPGGQHQNKTSSACRMIHKPTKLQVFITGRCQHANRREALRILTFRVNEQNRLKIEGNYDQSRKNQMMSGGDKIGGRGDKVRTYNFIQSKIVDHRLGVKTSNVKEFIKGNFSVLFNEGQKDV